MKLKTKALGFILAASVVVCGVAATPALAATPTTPAQAAAAVQVAPLNAAVKRLGIHHNFVASRVDIENETGEPIAFKYDSDGSGQGRDMNFINEDGTPVAQYSSRRVDPGYIAPFWIETHAELYVDATSGDIDKDAEADLYPIGVWSGTRYKPIRIRGNVADGTIDDYSFISADYTQGSAQVRSCSDSQVGSTELYNDSDGWSTALGITDQPVVLPAAK